ncbi:Hypothetical predicted protein [Mytilus galloprovincialis]|uniref:CCHC-type domain-containing protein n=1 Tax=Mytilus galloprovincialis TaxID=29158 RepID=A0A8B6H108_MYTGA|nr:Hypothetical predicted protein [Mytilus galloprovincialis]
MCSFRLKSHLDDKTVGTIPDAAVISDNYTLSHKEVSRVKMLILQVEITKNQSTERTDSKPVAQNKSQSSYNMSSPKFDTFEKKSLICAYCKKNGHLMSECFRLQKKNERENKPKSSACTTPYITKGVLPLSEKTSVGTSVLLQGVELGCINVPLHRIYLKSDLITGPGIVGVRPNLPVEGVTLLLGNDLARNKVVTEPIVTSEPSGGVKLPEDDAELYPACVVTRAMARKQQDEDLQENQFDYMDLSDTFLAVIEVPGSSKKALIRPPSVNKNVILPWPDVNSHSLNRKNFLEEQNKDPERPLKHGMEDGTPARQHELVCFDRCSFMSYSKRDVTHDLVL